MERDKKEVYEITEEVTQVVQNPSTQVASRPPPIPTVIPIQPYSYPYPVYSNPPSSNYQNQPASTGLSAAYSYNVQTCVDSVQAYSSGEQHRHVSTMRLSEPHPFKTEAEVCLWICELQVCR